MPIVGCCGTCSSAGALPTIPTFLDQLADVMSAGATNGQVLTFDAALAQWVPTTITGGGGPVTETITNMVYNPGTKQLTYVNEAGVVQTANLSDTVTNMVYNPATRTLTYTNEAGVVQTANLADVVTTMVYNPVTRTLTYTNEAGVVQTAVIAETITTLVLSPDRRYLLYNNEAGITTQILLPTGIEVLTTFPTTNLYDGRVVHVKYVGTFYYDTAVGTWVQM